MVATMDKADIQNTPIRTPANALDVLSKEFNGNNFYGLEYVVEDLFQRKMLQTPDRPSHKIDWFGLYD